MTEDNPFKIKNPEFSCHAPHEYSLEARVDISSPDSGYKDSRFSTLTFRTDQMGGYPIRISFRMDGEKDWYRQGDISEICVQIPGDFEADILKGFFQHVGKMMLPVYGDVNKEVDDIVGGSNK